MDKKDMHKLCVLFLKNHAQDGEQKKLHDKEVPIFFYKQVLGK